MSENTHRPDEEAIDHPFVLQALEDVYGAMDAAELTEVGPAFIQVLVPKLVKPLLDRHEEEEALKLRFGKGSHVLCNMGDMWMCGSVQGVNVPDPQQAWVTYPYVMQLDPPHSRLISAPSDNNDTIRPEVCFGQDSDGPMFTLMSLPHVANTQKAFPRRFNIGERVACLIEDAIPDPQGSVWAAGTVTEVDINMEEAVAQYVPYRNWPAGVPLVPYRVQLDKGCSVLVQKDEHWLVRDLVYQPEGPCDAKGPTRCKCTRIQTQQHGDSLISVDHMTRKTRPA